MTDATGSAPASGAAPTPLVDQVVVLCAACGASNDVWAETCACGGDLLADRRKIKVLKSSGEPKHLLDDRAKAAEKAQLPAQWEQAVRDFAALRRLAGSESDAFPTELTARIARLLLKLGRLDEAVVEANALHARHVLPTDVAVGLSKAYDAAADPAGADSWVARALEEAGDDFKARVPLVCERSRLLADHGRASEALQLLGPITAQLKAAIKATEKSGGATAAQLIVGGDPGAYAVSFWKAETDMVNGATKHASSIAKAAERAEREAAKRARASQRAAEGKTHWWER